MFLAPDGSRNIRDPGRDLRVSSFVPCGFLDRAIVRMRLASASLSFDKTSVWICRHTGAEYSLTDIHYDNLGLETAVFGFKNTRTARRRPRTAEKDALA